MPQRVLDAKIDFYNPATGALRYSLTSNLRRIQIEEAATDKADDAGFELSHDFADLSNFIVGDECRVYVKRDTDLALTHVWTGVLDNVRSDRQGLAFADLPLKATDFVYWVLAHTYVTDAYSNMSVGAIARDLMANHAPSITATSATVEDTDTTVPSITFNGESLLSALRRLAQFANATFKGDKDKTLHFYEKASKSSGHSASPSDVVRGSFAVETDFADFGNVVTVTGGKKKVADSASTGGAFSSWSVVTGVVRKKAQVFFSKSRVSRVGLWTDSTAGGALTGGLTVRIQANNAAGTAPVAETDPNYDLASVTLADDELTVGGWTYFDLPEYIGPPGNNCWVIVESEAASQRVGLDAGAALMWQTYFDLPIVVQVSDLASITAYGARSLQPVANANIQTEDEATALALRILAEHKGPVQSGSYEVRDPFVDLVSACIAQFYLDEAVGATTAQDTSEDEVNDFAVTGSVVFSGSGYATFDGATGYIGKSSLVGAPVGAAAPWALRVKFRPTGSLHTGSLIEYGTGGTVSPDSPFIQVQSGAGAVRFGLRQTGQNADTANGVVALDTDCELVLRCDGTTAYLYKNGAFVQSLAIPTNSPVNTRARVGARAAAAASNFFEGRVYYAEFFDRDLSAGEIAWLAEKGESLASLASAPVGQTVAAAFPADGVASDVIIETKRHNYDAEAGVYVLAHSFVSAQRIVAQEDVIRSMNDRLKRLEDTANATPVLYLVTSLNEGVKASDSVSAVETATSSQALVDSARVGFSIVA